MTAQDREGEVVMVKVPCGRTLGHGEACVAGYLCEQCAEIERLRAELAELRDTERERCAKIVEAKADKSVLAFAGCVAAAIRKGEP